MNTQPFLSKVMDLLLDTVCVVDEEGRYVFVNAASERLFGYKPEEMVGRNMIELVHPEDRERTLKTVAKIMRGQPQTHFENRYVRKDGEVVHVMWSARWSEADRVRLAVARDITALKRAARMQSAIYRISDAALMADSLAALYRHIHKIIGELLPATNFLVALYDEARDMLSYPYVIERRNAIGREPQTLGSGSPIAQVIHSGHALLTIVRDADPREEDEPADQGDHANWLGVPLVSSNGVIGALVLQTDAAETGYTEEDKDLLQFVSSQIATVIERKQADARMSHMALHDALTDLPNRALFHDRFDMALKRAERDGEQLALLYIDLDKFKHVNDTCGHAAGDALLREVARRLVQCVRGSDTVGRMGGDEFTVLLTNIRMAGTANLVADKIREAVKAPFRIGGRTLQISASIGAAVYPEHGKDKDGLLRHADTRMYAVKTGERG